MSEDSFLFLGRGHTVYRESQMTGGNIYGQDGPCEISGSHSDERRCTDDGGSKHLRNIGQFLPTSQRTVIFKMDHVNII
jgi:hypothetical protein